MLGAQTRGPRYGSRATRDFDSCLEPVHGRHTFHEKVDKSRPVASGGKVVHASAHPAYAHRMSERTQGEFIGELLDHLLSTKAVTEQQLATAIGMKRDSVINLRQNNKRAGLATIKAIARFFEMSVAAFIDESEARPQSVGTSEAHGIVHLSGESLPMPGTLEVAAPVGPFLPGDLIHLRRGEFSPGKWALVRGLGGQARLVQCVVDGGVAYLRTATVTTCGIGPRGTK